MAKIQKNKRGRPTGRTEQGEATQRHLYQVGLQLIENEGFENATLRKMAKQAGVSPGLFYKYFPSKGALVLQLHEELTSQFEEAFEKKIKKGAWMSRSAQTLRLSVETLAPHREALKALIPVLVGSEEQNIFSGFSQFSQDRVEELFYRSLAEATQPPPKEILRPLARLTYTAHLAVLLFWLLDKSAKQEASEGVLNFYEKLLTPLRYAIKLGSAKKMIVKADQIFQQGLGPKQQGNP